MSEWRPFEPSKEAVEAGILAQLHDLMDMDLRPTCEKYTPAGWAGHWRDWHRGHGCRLDPTP